jgi:very-long-chain ceramide synthase
MRYQVFTPLALLQLLNLFWYYLILRVIVKSVLVLFNSYGVVDDENRALTSQDFTDVRSDDEEDESMAKKD